jgi:hypothetical protein
VRQGHGGSAIYRGRGDLGVRALGCAGKRAPVGLGLESEPRSRWKRGPTGGAHLEVRERGRRREGRAGRREPRVVPRRRKREKEKERKKEILGRGKRKKGEEEKRKGERFYLNKKEASIIYLNLNLEKFKFN